MIVLISEKPSTTRAMASAAVQQWPGHEIYALHTLFIGTTSFRYPRGLAWHDYPSLHGPQFRLRPDARWIIHRMDAKHGVVPVNGINDESGESAARDLLHAADEVVFACDPDTSGVISYYRFLSCLMSQEFAREERPAILLTSLAKEDVAKSFREMTTTASPAFQSFFSYGRAKEYFDYNFNVNSHAILTRVLAGVLQQQPVVPISKYGLQTLYFLRKMESLTEAALLTAMNCWKGTSRYLQDNGHVQLGSVTSRVQIIRDLSENRLLSFSEDGWDVSLSPEGWTLLESLHPDCEDADLPFRLDQWCRAGLEESRPKIDRYLRTFFGKQKRFRGV